MNNAPRTHKQGDRTSDLPTSSAKPDPMQGVTLMVVRERAMAGLIELEESARRTIGMLITDHPGMARLLGDPLDPIHHPQRWGAVVMHRQGTISAQFEVDGVIVYYHFGPQCIVIRNKRRDIFTDVLLDLVETHRVRRIVAWDLGRLVRHERQGARLHAAFSRLGVLVTLSRFSLDLSLPSGSAIWSLLTMNGAAGINRAARSDLQRELREVARCVSAHQLKEHQRGEALSPLDSEAGER